MDTTITPAELDAIRAYKNEQARKWWANQSDDERRARRQRYAVNALRKRQAQAERDGENKRYEVKSRKRGKQ